MRSLDSLLITYAALTFSSVVILSLIGVGAVDLYIALFAVEFFVAIELTPGFRPTISRKVTIVEIFLVAGFGMIAIERVARILR